MQLPKLIRTTAKYTIIVNKKCKIIDGNPITVKVLWHRKQNEDIVFYMDYEFISCLDDISYMSINTSDTMVTIMVYPKSGKADIRAMSLRNYLAWKYSNRNISYREFKDAFRLHQVTDTQESIKYYEVDNLAFSEVNIYIMREMYAVLKVFDMVTNKYVNMKVSKDSVPRLKQHKWNINTPNEEFRITGERRFYCYTRVIGSSGKLSRQLITSFLFGSVSNFTFYEFSIIDGEYWFAFNEDTIIRQMDQAKLNKNLLPMGVSLQHIRYKKSNGEIKITNNGVFRAAYTNTKLNLILQKKFVVNTYGHDKALELAIAQRKEWEEMYGTTE